MNWWGEKKRNAYDISQGKIRATSPHADFQEKVYPRKEKQHLNCFEKSIFSMAKLLSAFCFRESMNISIFHVDLECK